MVHLWSWHLRQCDQILPLWLFSKVFVNGLFCTGQNEEHKIDSYNDIGLIFNVVNGHILKKWSSRLVTLNSQMY